MRVLAVCGAVLLVCGAVAAVDLKNEDSRSYNIKVKEGPATTSSSIDGNTTRLTICSDCSIQVEGVGSIEASGDEVVVIKDGKLSIED